MSKISKRDAEHFRSAMQDVRPLKAVERHQPARPPRSDSNRQRTSVDSAAPINSGSKDHFAALVADACENSRALCRDGLPRKALRTLGSAQNPVTDCFDLHGMTVSQASIALDRFLAECLRDGLRCVRVIHGKGLRSEGPAVLRLMSWQLLWQHPAVLALKPCSPKDGGSGAVLVMLESPGGDPT